MQMLLTAVCSALATGRVDAGEFTDGVIRDTRALCETQAHHALLDAFERRDGDAAEELMKSHLLDLVASLDLRNVAQPATSLREALQR